MPFRLLNRNGDLTVSVLDLAAVSLYETLYCHSTSSQPYLVGDGDGDPSGKPIKMLKKGGGGGGGRERGKAEHSLQRTGLPYTGWTKLNKESCTRTQNNDPARAKIWPSQLLVNIAVLMTHQKIIQ